MEGEEQIEQNEKSIGNDNLPLQIGKQSNRTSKTIEKKEYGNKENKNA